MQELTVLSLSGLVRLGPVIPLPVCNGSEFWKKNFSLPLLLRGGRGVVAVLV